MNKTYIKISFPILIIMFILNLFLIKIIQDPNIWYKILNMEGVIVGALFLASINFFFLLYMPKKSLDSIINFITLLVISVVFFFNRDFILTMPQRIELKYIVLKFSSIGALLYVIPFLASKYKKNLNSLFKILSLVIIIYIFSNLFSSDFKISFLAFIATAIFLSLLFYFSKD